MSGNELQRIEVLAEVLSRRRTEASAATILGISTRQTRRLVVAYRASGGASIIHKGRGRASNNRLLEGIREYAFELVRSNYADFGPSLVAEMLLSKHDLRVSRETLRKWMMADGLWLSRKQRRSFHQPRLRREAFGELIQIDGSDHRWFENRADACTLLVFIDDATSRLVQLRFVRSESTDSYLSAVHAYVVAFGCPVAFYSDKHTVFRINRANAPGGTGMNQFGRALAELNIEIICANSSQAKGRVERVNRTLQDRLVKELRLANISNMNAGNAFLPGFLLAHNEQFAVTPVRSEDMHRPLSVPVEKLTDILCQREQRYVGSQLTLSYDRKRIILQRNATSEDLGGKYVDVYDFPDGRLEVRSKGLLLPYSVFSKDQRVSHTAIVENKRLGHTLALIKAQQDSHFEVKVKTNSEKGQYQKRGRQIYGPDYVPKIPAKAATVAERTAKKARHVSHSYESGSRTLADHLFLLRHFSDMKSLTKRHGESMNSAQYRVVVVVDRGFGEKLESIPAGVPVWIVDSLVNRAAAEKAWAATPQVSHLEGITIFTSPEGASPERSLIGQIDTIDLHHGIYSADPPYSVLDVIGVTITEGIRSALEQNGFTEIHTGETGFRASQALGPELP